MNELLTHLCCYFVLTGLCSYHLLIELHAWTHLSFHVNFVFAPTHLGLFMQQWSNLWEKKVCSQIKRDLWGQSSIICLLFATRPLLLMNLIISWLLKAAVKSCFFTHSHLAQSSAYFQMQEKEKAEDLKAAGLFDSRPDRHKYEMLNVIISPHMCFLYWFPVCNGPLCFVVYYNLISQITVCI